jgi:hypothetical protein
MKETSKELNKKDSILYIYKNKEYLKFFDKKEITVIYDAILMRAQDFEHMLRHNKGVGLDEMKKMVDIYITLNGIRHAIEHGLLVK